MTNGIRRTLVGAALAPAMLFAASGAFGQDATVYGNEADYDAAAGASGACLDFNGSTGALVAGASFSADVAFGSPEASDPTQVNWSSDAISDAGSLASPNGVGPVDGTFTGTATAFKLTFLSAGTPPTVDLYAGDGTLIASVTAPNAPGFFGVVSSTPIRRFVATPASFAGTPNLDRFFIDDFCFTASVAPPPVETDPAAMCHELEDAIAAADAASFRGSHRQRALAAKMRVVCDRIEAGDAASLCAAAQKLRRDVLPKMDGERGPTDWVVDEAVQADLEGRIDALLAALDDAIDALGGCPDDPAHDGAGEEDGGQGKGRGNGQAHGHGHGRGRR